MPWVEVVIGFQDSSISRHGAPDKKNAESRSVLAGLKPDKLWGLPVLQS
jgi:hypothetical protein